MLSVNFGQITVIFLSLFAYGYCIKCFQCNSAEVPICNDLTVDNTTSPYFAECSGNYNGSKPFCRKIVTINNDVEGSERIVRKCGYILLGSEWNVDKCRKLDTDFIKTRSCQCFTDACNKAPSFLVTNISNVLLTMIISLLTFVNLAYRCS